jgi:hypothetical protein
MRVLYQHGDFRFLVDQMKPGTDWVWCADVPDGFFPPWYKKSSTPYGDMYVMGPFATERDALADVEKLRADILKGGLKN